MNLISGINFSDKKSLTMRIRVHSDASHLIVFKIYNYIAHRDCWIVNYSINYYIQ